jgi:hypothetical protein
MREQSAAKPRPDNFHPVKSLKYLIVELMKSTQDVFSRPAFIANIRVLPLFFLKRFCWHVFSEGKDAFRNGRIGNHDVLVVRNGYNIFKLQVRFIHY